MVILSSNVYNTFGIPTTSVIIGFNIVDISNAGCPLNLYMTKDGILRFTTDSEITNGNITVRIVYI